MCKYFVVMLVLLPAVVFAGEKVDRTLDVRVDGIVDIKNVRGDISIQSWEQAKVRVTGELDDKTSEFIFKTSGNETLIHVELDDTNNGEGSDLTIYVPEKSKVVASGVSCDFKMSGIQGGLKTNTVSGDLQLKNIAGGIKLKTVSGDANLVDGQGDFSVNTVSGDFNAQIDANKISIESVSGDFALKFKNLKEANVRTVSGDLVISSALIDNADVNISTVSGDISFSFNQQPNARFSIKTKSGDLSNSLSSDTVNLDRGGNARFTVGDGTGSFGVTTISGDIILTK